MWLDTRIEINAIRHENRLKRNLPNNIPFISLKSIIPAILSFSNYDFRFLTATFALWNFLQLYSLLLLQNYKKEIHKVPTYYAFFSI